MPTEVSNSNDVLHVEKILDGDANSWNSFVQEFSDRVWRRSWHLCNEACPHNKANVHCVFHSLAANRVQSISDDRPGCDEGLEIYAFTFDYLYNRNKGTGKLKHFDGRSKLETFVSAVLHGNMRTDWIRHKRKLRVDQITRPAEIQRLGEKDAKVFEQMVMQRPTETIAGNLKMDYDEARAAQERVTHALMANGNLHLILRDPEGNLDDFDRQESAENILRVIPIQRTVNRIWSAVCENIELLPESHKILLDMVFDKELDAKLILERCQQLDISLPVVPRSGKLTIHSIYQSTDHILKSLGTSLEQDHKELLNEARNWMDDDSLSKSVSVRGLKALLKNMGINPPPADSMSVAGELG
ncbi:MAG: hypothetical protein HKN43_01190 [Rhodothermales bacterium]|nr:hypothetical protein [Rhodothermales bacterium]